MEDWLRQYRAVRDGMGFIDRSETGKIAVCGVDRFSWLQGMVSNDVRRLNGGTVGGALQACVLDATGHIISDVSLIAPQPGQPGLTSLFGRPDCVLLDLPRGNVVKLLDLFDRYIISEDVEVKDLSETLACFSMQGPSAAAGWDGGFPANRDPFDRMRSTEPWIGSPADHTGSSGFDVYFPIVLAEEVRARIREHAVMEIDPEVQEILRVEAGIAKYGVDISESILAPEANLMATHVSLAKGCYVGQEVVARIDSRGHTNRALTGLLFTTGDAPSSGSRVFALQDDASGGREVGRVTSAVAASPAMNARPIGLGYVRHEHRDPGTTLRVDPNGQTAVVTELPFYRQPAH